MAGWGAGWLGGWLRKADNKAKAQQSWGLGFAELGNICQYLLALSFLRFIQTPSLARQDFPGRVAGWVAEKSWE